MPKVLRVLAISSIFATAACSDDRGGGGGNNTPPPPPRPIDAATAIATANANLRGVLGGAARASTFADMSDVLKDLASGSTDCTSEPSGGTGSSGCATMFDFEPEADDFAAEIAARALNMANLQLAEATRVVLALDPTRACTAVLGDGTPGTPDQECVGAFTETPIALELTSRTEGDVDLALLVGASQSRPITAALHAKELIIEIDLAAAKAAVEALVTAFGGDAGYLPETVMGRVRLAITKNADNDYSASFGVLSAVRVTSVMGEEPYDVEIGAAPSAATLHVDGNTRTITAATAMGTLRIELPLDLVYSNPTPVTGTLRIAAAGVTASTMVHADADHVMIDGLGLGNDAFRVTVDGQPFMSFDLNPSAGRKVDLELGSASDGLSVKATPKLELAAELDMQTIAGHGVEDVPSWALDETLRVVLEGAAAPELIVGATGDVVTGGSGMEPVPSTSMIARVGAGSLTINSRAASRTISVAAGQCLLQTDPPMGTTSAHPLDELMSGACP